MTELIAVHLACNDEHGNFAGEVCRVEFGDELLTLEGSPLPGEGLPFEWAEDQIRFGGDDLGGQLRLFDVSGRGHMVGNVFWDATQMSSADAQDLARYLLERGFVPTEWTCREPWESLADLSFEQPDGREH